MKFSNFGLKISLKKKCSIENVQAYISSDTSQQECSIVSEITGVIEYIILRTKSDEWVLCEIPGQFTKCPLPVHVRKKVRK